MLTEAEVMSMLGLRPWSEVEREARAKAQEYEDAMQIHRSSGRRSGRTWHMLVQAVIAVSEGKQVAVEGHRDGYQRELMLMLKDWCRRCGLNADRVLERPPRHFDEDVTYFTDHYVFEEVLEKILHGR